MAAEKALRVALIGYGRSGRDIHLKALSYLPDLYQVVVGVEIDPQRREVMRAELGEGVEVLDSYEQLYGRTDLDWVINASYSHMHYSITKDLLEHGFNVLCEKPLARTADEVRDLIETEKQSGKRLAVFQQSRFAPAFRKIQEIIASGDIGEVVQFNVAYNGFMRRWDWQTIQGFNGGSLYNTGPHPVDQALRILDTIGMPEITCYMARANTYGDAEDYVKLILHAPGRPVVDIEISSCCAYPGFTYNVQGTRGGIKGSTEELEWRYFIADEAPKQELLRESLRDEKGTPLYCRERLVWHQGSWAKEPGEIALFDRMGVAFYRMLHHATLTGEALEITLPQVLQQIAIIEECHKRNPLDAFVKV